MNRKPSIIKSLRARTEKLLQTKSADAPKNLTPDVQLLLRELNDQQIELEVENRRLAEARDRCADLYDGAPVGYISLNTRGTILSANLTAACLLGVERDSLVGMNLSRFVTRTSKDECSLHRRAVLAGDDRQSTEIEMHKSDGTLLRVQLESVRSGSGKSRQCHTVLIDVSERKDTEQVLRQLNVNLNQSLADRTRELHENVERLQLLSKAMAHMSEGVIITEDVLDWPGPHIRFVNNSMCRMSGYSSEELIGNTPQILQGKATDPETLARIRAELSAGDSSTAEVINYRKDGAPYHAELFITPLHDASGRRTNFVSIQRDITGRKTAEEQLSAREQALASFFSDAPIGLLWVDAKGRIVRVNRAQMEMLDRAETDLLNHAVTEFDGNGELHALVTEQAATGRSIRDHRAQIQRVDGTIRHVLIDATAVWKGTRLIRSEWFVRDITRRMELEHEVSSISEREQRRLGQDLHDDLCQMLTGIGFRCDTLAKGLDAISKAASREASSIARAIREATNRGRDLARGLCPLPTGTDGLAISLQELADRTADLFGIDCQFQHRKPMPIKDEAVGTHLYRIAQEAVANAVKHGKPRHIEIALSQNDGAVILAVRDDGRGFPKRRKNSGGMGLRVMNYRAGMIGGSIGIQHRDEGGTEVVCTARQKHNIDEAPS